MKSILAISFVCLPVLFLRIVVADPNTNAVTEELSMMLTKNTDETVDRIVAEREALIRKLMVVADPKSDPQADNKARAAAAYLLGKLRADEAVFVLARGLEEGVRPIGTITIHSRYDYPYFNALLWIGRASVPAMVELIRESDHEYARQSAVRVLGGLLGHAKRDAVLRDAMDKSKVESQRARIETMIKWAKENTTESKDRLY